jgi:hypothetical protein
MAAFVPEARPATRERRARPLLMGAAIVAAAGAVVAGAAGAAAGQHRDTSPGHPATGSLVRYEAPAIAPADVAPHGTR